jgi:hypothetical protein
MEGIFTIFMFCNTHLPLTPSVERQLNLGNEIVTDNTVFAVSKSHFYPYGRSIQTELPGPIRYTCHMDGFLYSRPRFVLGRADKNLHIINSNR